jgi:hypothetical protein
MHPQLARGAALIPFVFLEHGENESLLELPHTLGIQNIAAVHLQNECF